MMFFNVLSTKIISEGYTVTEADHFIIQFSQSKTSFELHFNNSGFLLFNFNLNYSQFSNKFILENNYYTTDESIIKGIYVPFNHILLVECDLLHINDLECYFITSPTQCSSVFSLEPFSDIYF